jgi:hypothetical protein
MALSVALRAERKNVNEKRRKKVNAIMLHEWWMPNSDMVRKAAGRKLSRLREIYSGQVTPHFPDYFRPPLLLA